MRNQALIQDRPEIASSHRLHAVRHRHEENFEEKEIEARIERLTERFKKTNAASNLVWLKSGPHIYNPTLDLSVKVEAIRWMLRIAKPMSEPAREVMLLRIENSMRKLEAAVESRMRSVDSGATTERLQLRCCAHA
jgi:hypothetical protein